MLTIPVIYFLIQNSLVIGGTIKTLFIPHAASLGQWKTGTILLIQKTGILMRTIVLLVNILKTLEIGQEHTRV